MCLPLQPNCLNKTLMKRTLRTLGVLLAISVVMTSCLGDNDNDQVTTYSDMAITAFTLGTIPRYTTTTSTTTGNDTTIRTTISGTAYPMTIDQLSHTIYNQEALPMGTDVRHVVCTVTAKNSGAVALQSMTSDSLSWFNATDSIDFSVPRTFRVYAIDGSGYRDYRVTVNVSQTTGTTFDWKKEGTGATDFDAERCTDVRLLCAGSTLVLMPRVTGIEKSGADETRIIRVSSDGLQWTTLGGFNELAWQGAATQGETLYVKTGDQLLRLGGDDGWNSTGKAVAAGLPAGQLIGASSTELFILGTDGALKRSNDGGLTWQTELLDDSADLLPTENIATVTWPYAPADNTDYVLMVGNSRQQADGMSQWRKISEQGEQGRWVYMPTDDSNSYYTLPRMNGLSMACYDGRVLAVGSGLKMFESRDQGVSWQVSATYALPTAFAGTAVAMTADSEGRLWLVSNNGDVWKGQKY